MTEPTQPEPQVQTKVKVGMIAAVVGFLMVLGVAGQLLIGGDDAAASQQPVKVAAQQKPQTTPCTSKTGQKVPKQLMPLCVVVTAQPAYETPSTGTPKGSVLVKECRAAARLESIEAGEAKVGQTYLMRCLVNEHEMWWDWQAKVTEKMGKTQKA